MAAPLVFNEFLGWLDVVDAQNIPPGTRLITAADLLRYENFLVALRDRINSHETSLLDIAPKVATLITDVDAVEAANTAQSGLITTLQNDLDAAEANIAALTRGFSVNSTAQTLNKANRVYVHTGGAVTLTLPPVGTHAGVEFIVKNRGSASITLATVEAAKLWNTSAITSLSLGIGTFISVYCDGTFWNRIT